MNATKVYKNPVQFLAVTSLHTEEFDMLLKVFTHRWQQWYKYHDFKMKRRAKPLSASATQGQTRTLPSDLEKLFFILYIFKNNPLQQVAAATFDMDQGQVSKWIKILSPILEQSIEDLHLQPARDMDELVRLFRDRQQRDDIGSQHQTQVQTLNIDATERPIGRSVDYEAQQEDYSGKQKCHTAKNTVMCDEYQFIHFLGLTWRGAVHDKKMIENEIPDWSDLNMDHIWLTKDTGYQGYNPSGVIVLEPFKALRGKPLTDLKKQINTSVSSIRIVVEHAIGGVKRLRLVSEKWRLKLEERLDQAMAIAVGLHNLRIVNRKAAYAHAYARTGARLDIFRS